MLKTIKTELNKLDKLIEDKKRLPGDELGKIEHKLVFWLTFDVISLITFEHYQSEMAGLA